MKLILAKTHDYTACPNVDEYIANYAGTDYFHSQTIDINLGERAKNLGTDVAREIAKLTDKPMIPAIILSDYKDQLEEAEKIHGKLFSAYIWKEDKQFTEKVLVAIAIAEARGPNQIEQYRVIANDCKCDKCKESLTGFLHKEIPGSHFTDPFSSGIHMDESGFADKETINSLLDGCIDSKKKGKTETALTIVEKLIIQHSLGKF
jgi:hypothetical protein